MKNKIMLTLLLAGIMVSASACSFDIAGGNAREKDSSSVSDSREESSQEESVNETTEVSEKTESSDESTAEESSSEATDANSKESALSSDFSGDIFSFEVSLDGQTYKIPMTYSEFTGLGWKMNGDDSEQLKENQYTLSDKFENGDFKVSCQIVNLDSESKPVSDCYIGKISIDAYDLKDTSHTVELPDGIAMGKSTMEDVKSAYGEPDDTYTGSSYSSYTYKDKVYSTVKISFDSETNVISGVEIQHFEK